MGARRADAGQQAPTRLSDFLRARRRQLIAAWCERVRALAPARELTTPALIDHVPDILLRVADVVHSGDDASGVTLDQLPHLHAVDRLSRGFDLDQIVTEYSLLRRVILDQWQADVGGAMDVTELRRLDDAFDEAIRQSVVRYALARERLLKAVDRVSSAALGSSNVGPLLADLLAATIEGTQAVDACAVLLREGERLRVRASLGTFAIHADAYVDIGEGFTGRVAAEARPIAWHAAATAGSETATTPFDIDRDIAALYGVPLMRDGKVIGVAYIGSRTAHDFSEEDKLLFRSTVSRATSAIVKAQVLADLARAEVGQRFLAEASRQLAESLDTEATLAKIAHLAVPTIAEWCAVHVLDGEAVRRVSTAHSDPKMEALAEEMSRRYPVSRDDQTGVAAVLRTGEPQLVSDVDDTTLSRAARDAAQLELLQSLRLRSYIVVPIKLRAEVFGAITLVTAESGRRYSDEDLRLAEELARRAAMAIHNARLYAESRQAVQVRERILAVVSHDLRNHLGIIGSAAQMVRTAAERGDTRDVAKRTSAIERSARAMARLVDDLLDMASIQAGRLSLHPARVELKPLLEDSLQTHETLAAAKGITLRADLALDGVAVQADAARLLQAFGNLLGNAIKYTPRGGDVTVRGEATPSEAIVSVIDSGRGIPNDQLNEIFEPYRTIRREGKTGTGLGLYIANGIVTRHGGRMSVQSEVGSGSTFTIALPRAT